MKKLRNNFSVEFDVNEGVKTAPSKLEDENRNVEIIFTSKWDGCYNTYEFRKIKVGDKKIAPYYIAKWISTYNVCEIREIS